MPSKNAKRREQKLEATVTALNGIKAPVGSPKYVEQVQTILKESKLPLKNRIELEIKYHIPQPVALPALPTLSRLQQQLLGKAMLEQLLGFPLTKEMHRQARAEKPLYEWYAYGYTLYAATYERLCSLALDPRLVEQKKQSLTLSPGVESIEARLEVDQYLAHKARAPGMYAAAKHYQENEYVGLVSFLIDMPKPLSGKIVLATIAHMLDSLIKLVLEETAVSDKLENVPFGRCAQGDLGHLLFADPYLELLKKHVRVVTFPTLPGEFISQFNEVVQGLPKELQVANQDSECRLAPIYTKYYNHLAVVKDKYGMNHPSGLSFEDLARLNRLPLTEFHLEELLNAFFIILQAAQAHLLADDEEIIAAPAKASSGVGSSSSSSSALPSGVSVQQLTAAYASPLPPVPRQETKSPGLSLRK